MTESPGKRKLKILFFAQRFPYPMDTGGKIRTGKLLEQLNDIFDITLVSNVESPKDDEYLDQVKKLCTKFHSVPWKEAKKYSFRFYLKLLRSVFSRYPFTVINDYSKDLEAALIRLTTSERFDLLVCDFLQPSLNFKRLKGTPTLLFEHNVESVIPRRHFETSRNPVVKCFWWLQWWRMNRYERETCRTFTTTVTVSESDKQTLKDLGIDNVFAIPTGVDADYFAPSEEPPVENSLVFTGSMDWLPNEDAIIFFAKEILKRIKAKVTTVKLSVVGRKPRRYLLRQLRQYPEIEILGWVDDVRSYISRHAVYVIPLRIGGGTRIKVYEAMAMRKAVVSTRVGVEGLPVENGSHVVVADTAADFADAVVLLLQNHKERRRLELGARKFVEENICWRNTAEAFATIIRQCVSTSSRRYEMKG
jgi:glycosyltransferase involved in cell wall biosynthesis